MASQPSQAARRRSPRDDEQAASPTQRHPDSSPKAIEDSEYFLLNHSQAGSPPRQQQESSSAQNPGPGSASPPREVRECWICREEDTDDTPENSVWRSPCPCSLQAHESCLLEWITDKEAPRPGDIASSAGEKIVCPVCKSPYQIDRPKDYLVMTVERLQRLGRFMILPTAASTIAGTLYSGLMIYGINSLQLVFGTEAAAYLMTPSHFDRLVLAKMQSRAFSRFLQLLVKLMDPFFPAPNAVANWKFFLGLPMIAPALVLSRTKLADPVFAFMPVTYFFFQSGPLFKLVDWPPSPALTFAALPGIRTAYNQLYRQAFGELEAKWDKAVQRAPREGETAEQMAADQAGEVDENALFDLQLEFINEEIHEDDHDHDDDMPALVPLDNGNQGQQQEGQEQGDLNHNHEHHLHPVAVPPNIPVAAQGRRPPRNEGQWEIRQNISTAQIASTVMGALFLPAISSIMGDILKLTLPSRWVAKSVSTRFSYRLSGAGGILSEKWGRSVVGGCLFVVLKDVVVLYCKWRKARDFGKRKILDYVKKNPRSSSSARAD